MALVLDATIGGANSNSYATVADGDDYAASRLFSTVWTSSDVVTKTAALVWATRVLDASMDWNGYRASFTQALRWPRAYAYGADNYMYQSNVIPPQVIQAVCELARLLMIKDRSAETGREGIGSLEVGPIKLAFDKSDAPRTIPDSVYQLIASLGSIAQVSTRGGVEAIGLIRA